MILPVGAVYDRPRSFGRVGLWAVIDRPYRPSSRLVHHEIVDRVADSGENMLLPVKHVGLWSVG